MAIGLCNFNVVRHSWDEKGMLYMNDVMNGIPSSHDPNIVPHRSPLGYHKYTSHSGTLPPHIQLHKLKRCAWRAFVRVISSQNGLYWAYSIWLNTPFIGHHMMHDCTVYLYFKIKSKPLCSHRIMHQIIIMTMRELTGVAAGPRQKGHRFYTLQELKSTPAQTLKTGTGRMIHQQGWNISMTFDISICMVCSISNTERIIKLTVR